jgi:FkbM family methyltransferase
MGLHDHPLVRRARSLLRGTTFDFGRFSVATHPLARRQRLIANHGIDLLFDIGANIGQYALEMRDLGYTGWLVSYEPLSTAFRELDKRAARDPKWKTVRAGLGREPGTAVLHVAANSQSSSLLPMLDQHVQSAPESRTIGTETVTIETLATVLAEHAELGKRPFVKIDAQGFERQILEGAGSALAGVVGLQLEMSLVPLYEGESLMSDMLAYLQALGFELMSLESGYTDPQTGRMLQLDGIFFRS